ncbi:manganese efflux pump MntP family protein [Dehalobacterium formicoaceticum]|uniref:Manganese efflux pump n=2 Tax=Dehalobacterium formicoaceticum TaxID=51515 RepID=A0ABT1Y7U2_9FIRM|nr:manganese efflux pump [Dehalobacterium formicoaceticum]MCR6546943.1 manganese efflux pump [Dehalobacterium formicoaceticum]
MAIEEMEIILLAIGISLDAFAVMTIQGAMIPTIHFFNLIKVGVLFGGWQTLVITLSSALTQRYIVSNSLMDPLYIREILGVLATGIFVFLGLYLIWKARHHYYVEEKLQERLYVRKTFRLAIVTSLDALLAGISMGIMGVSVTGLLFPFMFISVLAVFLGVYVGHWFGYEPKTNAYYLGATIILVTSLNMALSF